jgi:ActD protein
LPSAVPLYGLMAEFTSPEALVDAARRARGDGYLAVEAYSPISIEGLAETLGFHGNRVGLLTLLGGIAGGVGGYFLQWYSAVIDYPINSGGRPLHSWPAFIPATFELTVLGAALAAFVAFVLLNGLPRLNHPMFNAPDFDLASRSRFFLCIRANDTRFDLRATDEFLRGLAPVRIAQVPLEETS